ncbi:hypothetical protein [Ohtaekwangia koreensis]|uniref:hypothetical protein n=1 Tax=Ohtaekwangia koreensis TaxID=688867 RepID=UPI001180513A|nr:hypothetical protein [Ohtaekwangia koreensis]
MEFVALTVNMLVFVRVPFTVSLVLLANMLIVPALVNEPAITKLVRFEADEPAANAKVPLFVTDPVDDTVKSAVVPVAELLIVSWALEPIIRLPFKVRVGEVIVLPVKIVIVVPAAPEGILDAATQEVPL